MILAGLRRSKETNRPVIEAMGLAMLRLPMLPEELPGEKARDL